MHMSWCRWGAGGAHPRRCGEHSSSLPIVCRFKGSSPQVRGTFEVSRSDLGAQRLIPAGAGNMGTGAGSSVLQEAHPRRCGEHHTNQVVHVVEGGSSPQVRGTFVGDLQDHVADGLIPAGAGNMRRCRTRLLRRGAHPRRCGEHAGGGRRGHSSFRLIPAGAGNIRKNASGDPGSRAHPRRCGEHVSMTSPRWMPSGSSPQVRGTSHLPAHRCALPGLIPAGAGNMSNWSPPGRPWRAHPRRCGEHYYRREESTTEQGSSPQVRGTS